MGLPALRQEPRSARARTPRLSVVRTAPPKPNRSRSTVAAAQAARSAFRTFAIVVIITAVLGIGRVYLSVQAAEASMEANRLRGDIKNERYEGDMLEVRQSALGSPSRIRAIAGQAMSMAPAQEVTYLDLQQRPPVTVAGVAADKTVAASVVGRHDGAAGFVARMMDLTAGEAQVLLVGDIGLTSSK